MKLFLVLTVFILNLSIHSSPLQLVTAYKYEDRGQKVYIVHELFYDSLNKIYNIYFIINQDGHPRVKAYPVDSINVLSSQTIYNFNNGIMQLKVNEGPYSNRGDTLEIKQNWSIDSVNDRTVIVPHQLLESEIDLNQLLREGLNQDYLDNKKFEIRYFTTHDYSQFLLVIDKKQNQNSFVYEKVGSKLTLLQALEKRASKLTYQFEFKDGRTLEINLNSKSKRISEVNEIKQAIVKSDKTVWQVQSLQAVEKPFSFKAQIGFFRPKMKFKKSCLSLLR